MRSFTLSVSLVLLAFILLSGGTIADAQEVISVAKDVPAYESPQTGTAWSAYGWLAGICGGLVTAWAAFKSFLKRNNVDMDDPKVRSYLILAAQVALIGIAILVLRLAKKSRGENKKENPNAKFVDSVLTELIVLAQWMSAAVVTEKFAPNMDPMTLASSLGAKPETIHMLVASAKPKKKEHYYEESREIKNPQPPNPLDRFNRRSKTSGTQNEQKIPQKPLPEIGRRGYSG